jgi:Family of unknown function (DUF6236)
MNRTILYYPTIDIPRNSWLRHALLYWDEVSSIVPKSWDDDILVELSPDIRYLIDEEQFRPIKPEDLIFKKDNWEAFHQFQEEFREIASSKEFQTFVQRQHRSNYRIHINKVGEGNFARVHSNKTSDGILHFLEDEGLAKRNMDSPEWLIFESNTALLYMSLLAKYLADIDSEQTTIGTDYGMYEKFNFKRVAEDEGFPVISFSLNNILPTPKPNVPLENIIHFKRKRADNLRHFKKSISEFQTKVAKANSQAELKEIAITFQESIVTGVQDLSAVLGDSKIESTLKTFKSLINLKSPTAIASVGAIANEKLNFVNVPFSWEALGLVTIGAIELSCNYIELRNKNRAKLRESPFSYIYQAQRYGIIERYR